MIWLCQASRIWLVFLVPRAYRVGGGCVLRDITSVVSDYTSIVSDAEVHHARSGYFGYLKLAGERGKYVARTRHVLVA